MCLRDDLTRLVSLGYEVCIEANKQDDIAVRLDHSYHALQNYRGITDEEPPPAFWGGAGGIDAAVRKAAEWAELQEGSERERQ